VETALRGSVPAPADAAGGARAVSLRALSLRATLLGAIGALGLLLGLGAVSASALVVHLADGHTLSYQPASRGVTHAVAPLRLDEAFGNLDYNGGPVMPSNENYAVYWAPSASAYPSDYRSGVDTYFEDLAHDSGGHENVDSVSTQYNDAAGQLASYDSQFGGDLLDTHPYPKNGCKRAAKCLTDEQIRIELVRFAAEKKLPADLSHEYFLLTPKGVESCFEPGGEVCSAGVQPPFDAFCAYHGNIPLSGGRELIYANDPYVTEGICDDKNHPNGTTADAVLSGGLSHEHNESLTDPEPNNAWTDFATGSTSGYEIGDKCRTFEAESEFGTPLGKAPDGAEYNQVINGHLYWYQQEWSNQGHRCLQRFTLEGQQPIATFTSTVEAGDQVRFDASGSTAGAGVRYSWQFNDFGTPSTPVETSSRTVTHTFPGIGTYTVALTVFAPDGTSFGTDRHVVVETPQTIEFTTSAPTSVTVGDPGYVVAAAASSGLPVSFSTLTPAVCLVSGSTVTYLGAGTCTVEAEQPGDATYLPAHEQQSFEVGRRAQAVQFTTSAPAAATVGGASYGVAASSSSGLAVTFSSGTPAVCMVSGSGVSFAAAGTCTVYADQAGDFEYLPAPRVQQSFSVAAAPAPAVVAVLPVGAPLASPLGQQGVSPFQQTVRLLPSRVQLGAIRGRRGRTSLEGGAAVGRRATLDIRRYALVCRGTGSHRHCSRTLMLHQRRSLTLLARQTIALPPNVTVRLTVAAFSRQGSDYAATSIERRYR
jgi:PKD repeat protein